MVEVIEVDYPIMDVNTSLHKYYIFESIFDVIILIRDKTNNITVPRPLYTNFVNIILKNKNIFFCFILILKNVQKTVNVKIHPSRTADNA